MALQKLKGFFVLCCRPRGADLQTPPRVLVAKTHPQEEYTLTISCAAAKVKIKP